MPRIGRALSLILFLLALVLSFPDQSLPPRHRLRGRRA